MAILSHDEMRDLLKESSGKQFVYGTVGNFVPYDVPYENIRYLLLSEFTIRYYDESNVQRGRKGFIKADENRRFDALLFVRPGEKSIARGFTYTIGVELKGDVQDLKRDDKIYRYVGWVDFMYIGVPDEMADEAIRKVQDITKEHPQASGLIGVVGVRTGQIYMCPTKKSPVRVEYGLALYKQAVDNYILRGRDTVSFDCEDIENTPVPVYQPKESTPTPPPSITAITAAVNGSAPSGSSAGHSAGQLTEDQRKTRAEMRAANRERVLAQKKEMAQRNATLMPTTKQSLAGLSDRDNLVFWAVRDATDGIDAKALPGQLGQSPAGIARSIAHLKKAGLIALDGSKKTGKFRVVGSAAKNSRCMSCVRCDQCKGNALMCGEYQAID